ncbi:MAG: HAMP domain-containing protein [Verrucomicrobiota bacterium]
MGLLLTDARITDPDARMALATDVINGCESLAGVAVYRPDGTLLDALYRTDGKLSAKKPTPPEHLSPKVISTESGTWHPVHAADSGAVMHYIEPVEQQRQLRAFALGMVTPQSLGQQAQRIAQDHCGGRGDCILVLDAEQRIIAGGMPSGELSIGQSLKGRDILGRAALTPEIMSQPLGFTWQFRSVSGEKMIGSVRMLPEYGWILAVRRPLAQAFGVMRSVQLSIIGSTLMLLLVAVLYGGYIAKRTTRPIQKLVELTRAYAERRFAERSAIHTRDELEELGNSLTDMAHQLSGSEKEIARRARIENGLSRFLPEEVARSIASGHQPLALGGQRRNISVLFADVVAFTRFAESAPPRTSGGAAQRAVYRAGRGGVPARRHRR